MAKSISGKVVYQDLGMGLWGIVDDSGNQWQPINFPEQLKYKGARVAVMIQELDMATTAMWGQPVRVLSFRTLMP